ncbi:MAG: metallophosphoesterase [Lachnospiraceae bacterium]|nr:metallophosphoesterase [Lachnospiraceae bacterium]
MIYYTADLHFGYEELIKKGKRPMFPDVETMNRELIRRWNDRVTEEDEVYIVGDLAYRGYHEVGQYLAQLKGKKHFIIGNHDDAWLQEMKHPEDYFLSIDHLCYLKDGERPVTLCHYPLCEWPGSEPVSAEIGYMIHGHIHNNPDHTAYKVVKAFGMKRLLNCGVDMNDFRPVTFDELVANNEKWYWGDVGQSW